MALQSLRITPITAMRARDVSRPTSQQQEAADRHPLRDEIPHKAPPKKGEPRGAEPKRGSGDRRRDG